MSKLRSVHGGANSHLCVEISAWWQDADGVHICNDEPARATAYGVYIRNPMAMHVSDFCGPQMAAEFDPMPTLADAKDAAFVYADALADHLGCKVETFIDRPCRYAIEPQRDMMLDGAPWLQPGCIPDTQFEACEEERATQWAVFDITPGLPGLALVEDYPSRIQAENAVAALMAGNGIAEPVWPEPSFGMYRAAVEVLISASTEADAMKVLGEGLRSLMGSGSFLDWQYIDGAKVEPNDGNEFSEFRDKQSEIAPGYSAAMIDMERNLQARGYVREATGLSHDSYVMSLARGADRHCQSHWRIRAHRRRLDYRAILFRQRQRTGGVVGHGRWSLSGMPHRRMAAARFVGGAA